MSRRAAEADFRSFYSCFAVLQEATKEVHPSMLFNTDGMSQLISDNKNQDKKGGEAVATAETTLRMSELNLHPKMYDLGTSEDNGAYVRVQHHVLVNANGDRVASMIVAVEHCKEKAERVGTVPAAGTATPKPKRGPKEDHFIDGAQLYRIRSQDKGAINPYKDTWFMLAPNRTGIDNGECVLVSVLLCAF
jgi:hypothetical protein